MVNNGHPNKVNKVCNGKLVTVSVIKSRDVWYSDSTLSQTDSVWLLEYKVTNTYNIKQIKYNKNK